MTHSSIHRPKFGVVASIQPASADEFFTNDLPAAVEAQTIEVRLEKVRKKSRSFLQRLAEEIPTKPVILGLKPKRQGGIEELTMEMQQRFWTNLPRELEEKLARPGSNIVVDWDVEFIRFLEQVNVRLNIAWENVGVNVHDYEKTPEMVELEGLLRRVESTPALSFLKVVTRINNPADLARVQKLYRIKRDDRPLSAFGMGELGLQSRFLCLIQGGAATYACLPGRQTAPGQPTIEQLVTDWRVQHAL